MLILSNKILNKKYVGKCLIGIFISVFLCIIFLTYYFNGKFPEHVNFIENGNIDYKVYLEKNEFFVNKYLGKDRQYIAELIDYISTDFEYNILLDNDNISYKYDYKIEMEAEIIDKETENIIFNKRKEVICKQDLLADNGIYINENVKVDYNYYNKLVKELINTYGLMDNVKSTLFVKLYVNYECEFNELKDIATNEVILTMQMPLNERTVDISLDNDVFSLKNDVFIFKSNTNYTVFLIFSLIFGGIAIYLTYTLIKYYVNINNYTSTFDKNLSKILKNYSSYIQKAEGSFDFRDYKILIVDEFESMLELRDMLSKPIMMIEDSINGIVKFVIASNDIAYIYQLMK